VWHSIPYALPPTGEFRWQAPRPADEKFLENNITSSTIVDASKPGPACIHGCPAWELKCRNKPFEVPQTEDCLRLDILAPTTPKLGAALLPVVVKIHGGGFAQGRSDYIPGFNLISHTRGGIVYVSIQYRLGVYGFLASKDVQGDGVANGGLLDQRIALDWIKRNIEKFGGDPEKVTITGGSAGGGSVTAQMMLYGAVDPPPFRAAIAGE
jgi:carboxylesterase type B